MIIGIDFGTCFSSVSVMSGMVANTSFLRDSTGRGMPTAFIYDPATGREVMGEAAEAPEYYPRSRDIVRYIKRTVREDPSRLEAEVSSGGRSFTYSYIIERYLAFLIDEIRRGAQQSGSVENTEVEAVTVTVPVGISHGQMMAFEYNQLIRDVVKRVTGLPDGRIYILQEPVAAALSYLYSNGAASEVDEPATVLVFDLGGGTLDVTVVEYDPDGMDFRIWAKEGDLSLGGNDWDAVLADLVRSRTGIGAFSDPAEEARFERAVIDLKVNLSRVDEDAIFFKYGGRSKTAVITREELEEAASGLTHRAGVLALKTVHSAGLAMRREDGEEIDDDAYFESDEAGESLRMAMSDIDKVVMVGGGSNLPSVRKALMDFLRVPEDMIVQHNPSKAIAMGAGIYAKLRVDAGDGDSAGVSDIVSHSYGVIACVDGVEHVHVLVYRGDPFDGDGRAGGMAGPFTPHGDDYDFVTVRVVETDLERFQCSEDLAPLQADMVNMLSVRVDVPPEYRGRARSLMLAMALSTDVNGLLEITVFDMTSHQRLAFGTNRM